MTGFGSCIDCASDVEHCHGSFVVHPDGSTECTDDECAASAESHDHMVECSEIRPECRCG